MCSCCRVVRPQSVRDRHDVTPDPRDQPQGPAHQRRDGHRHRVPHGDRHGPRRRHRRAAPQPVARRPGLPGRPGQAHPDRHHLQPRDDRPRRDARGPRPHLWRVPRLRAPRRRHRQPPPRHHHQPRPEVHAGRRVGIDQGRRGHDPDAPDHRATRASPARTPRCCCASTSASGCRWSTTPVASSDSSRSRTS